MYIAAGVIRCVFCRQSLFVRFRMPVIPGYSSGSTLAPPPDPLLRIVDPIPSYS